MPNVGDTARTWVFEVRSSATKVEGTVSVNHFNKRDAAHAALRQVRRDRSIPQAVALFATQKTQEVK